MDGEGEGLRDSLDASERVGAGKVLLDSVDELEYVSDGIRLFDNDLDNDKGIKRFDDAAAAIPFRDSFLVVFQS